MALSLRSKTSVLPEQDNLPETRDNNNDSLFQLTADELGFNDADIDIFDDVDLTLTEDSHPIIRCANTTIMSTVMSTSTNQCTPSHSNARLTSADTSFTSSQSGAQSWPWYDTTSHEDVSVSQSLGTPAKRPCASSSLTTPLRALNTPRRTLEKLASMPPLATPVRTPSKPSNTPALSRSATRVKRKFPGPAGVLPKLAPGQSIDQIKLPSPSPLPPYFTPRRRVMVPVTNTLDTSLEDDTLDFTRGPWVAMTTELELDSAQSHDDLSQYNIAAMLKKANKRRLKKGKIPYLKVLLKTITHSGISATAVVKDPTGEMLGTFHCQVIKDHKDDLVPGCGLILRQVSVLTPSPRRHYLNITLDNIVRLYSLNGNIIRDVVYQERDQSTTIIASTSSSQQPISIQPTTHSTNSSNSSSPPPTNTHHQLPPSLPTDDEQLHVHVEGATDEFDDFFDNVDMTEFEFD